MVKLTKKGVPRKKTNANPSPATRWKKGQTGNPLNKNRMPPVAKEIKIYTRQTIAETYNKYINCSLKELDEVRKSDSLPAIEVIVAGALFRDMVSGEMTNTEIILDRSIGKIPNVTELGGIGGTPLTPPVINFLAVSPEDKKITVDTTAEVVKTPEISSANAENTENSSLPAETSVIPGFTAVDPV